MKPGTDQAVENVLVMKPRLDQGEEFHPNITLSMLEDDDVFHALEESELKTSRGKNFDERKQTCEEMESLHTPTLFDLKRLTNELDFKDELSPVHNCAGKPKCSLVSPLLRTPTLVDGLFSMLTKTVFEFPEVVNDIEETTSSQGVQSSFPHAEQSENMGAHCGGLYKHPDGQNCHENGPEKLNLDEFVGCPSISLVPDLPQTPKTPTNSYEMQQFITWQRRPQDEDTLSYSSLAESTTSLCSLYSQDEDQREDATHSTTDVIPTLKDSAFGLSLSLCSLRSQDEDMNNNLECKSRMAFSDYDSATSLESLDVGERNHKLKRRFQNVCTAVKSKRRKIQRKLRRLTADMSRCDIKETVTESASIHAEAERDIAYRNKMERERRSKMNDKFEALRETIPDMENMNKASKLLVLNRAGAYIKELEQEGDILSSQLFIEKEKNKKLLERLVTLTTSIDLQNA